MSKEQPPMNAQEVAFSAYETPTMALKHVRGYSSYLSGKIKTIIDAAIEDPQRRKALKDLVHNAIWSEGYDSIFLWSQQEVAQMSGDFVGDYYFPFRDTNLQPITE